jgi:hypothetical protein
MPSLRPNGLLTLQSMPARVARRSPHTLSPPPARSVLPIFAFYRFFRRPQWPGGREWIDRERRRRHPSRSFVRVGVLLLRRRPG